MSDNNILRELQEHVVWMEHRIEEYTADHTKDSYDAGYYDAAIENINEIKSIIKRFSK